MDLLKKNNSWSWTSECQTAFEELKRVTVKGPILRITDVTEHLSRDY